MENETKVVEQESSVDFEEVKNTEIEAENTVEETEFKKADEDNDKEEESKDETKEDSDEDDSDDKNKEDDKKDDFSMQSSDTDTPAIDYEQKYNDLESKYALVIEELNELRSFKARIENEQKDELIGKFYMLTDEDKADVIANKAKYSLDEIEARLSVICFRKKVNFDLDTSDKNEDNTEDNVEITTYNLSEDECAMPAWIKEALARQNKE